MTTNKEEQSQMALDCEKRGFIDSISYRLGNGFELTDKQVERLEQVWERVT